MKKIEEKMFLISFSHFRLFEVRNSINKSCMCKFTLSNCKMVSNVCILLLFLIEISAKEMGCISNTTFLSLDIKETQSNLTFDQCLCYLWYHNYSGFNYFQENETCEVFHNFTNDFVLEVNTQTRFCFNNQPAGKT
jgi:hypothetical protein